MSETLEGWRPWCGDGLKQRHVGFCMRGELMKARLELAFCSCGAVGEKE